MENPENTNATDTVQKKYLKILEKLHSLILQQKLTHNKAISEIRIDDLISTFLKEESEELSEGICNKLKERVLIARKKEIVWAERKKIILKRSRALGVILKEDKLDEIIFQTPYNCKQSFEFLLETKIQQWEKETTEVLKSMEEFGIPGTVADLNEDSQKKFFKVTAVFEVEYFKNKEQELISVLEKRLKDAHFKTMPQIKVEPLVEIKQLEIDFN